MNRYTIIVTLDLRGAGSDKYRQLDSLLVAAGYERSYPELGSEHLTSNTYVKTTAPFVGDSIPGQQAGPVLKDTRMEIQTIIRKAKLYDCQAFIVTGAENCISFGMTTYPADPPRWQAGEAEN